MKFTDYGRLVDIGERFGAVVARRVADLPLSAQPEAVHAFQVFVEYTARLHFRLLEVVEAEGEVGWYDDPPPRYTLQEAQMRYVDKVEAFHQHVYAALSALCMLLLRIHVRDGSHPPKNSVKAFIEWVACRVATPDAIDTLQASREFRAAYVDHPQQHAVRDWTTFRGPDDVLHVIYFERLKDGEAMTPYEGEASLDPRSPNFRMPMPCKRKLVPPVALDTLRAFLAVTDAILTSLLPPEP